MGLEWVSGTYGVLPIYRSLGFWVEMAWVWRLGWFGLIGFRDLSSLSLSLGVNRPLLPVVVRFTISSFPELVDLFRSRENEVKVWIFDYIFFSASKLV